ncbi:CLUMA_CG017983, isoform B [Clunio marinus]|uniref:CLUMA_CG017983, isoform B n=1 Tax=Clunio marinus TaxID=568069 RepID=A0A1J1J0Q1_9DIPT|nr:CLUMA_CG017983, isoform B [Clunio marinus]
MLIISCYIVTYERSSHIFLAYSSPLESSKDDDDYLQDGSDGDYNEDDYNESEDKKQSTVSSIDVKQYKTQGYTEKVDVGKSIKLKCLGENFDSDTFFMWYNESSIIISGEVTVGEWKDRIEFEKKDGSLTIKNTNPFDDATFRCRAILTKNKVNYETIVHLEINGPPRGIKIGHNVNTQENIAGETLVYKAGQKDLRFKCHIAKARPEAKIVWIHNGNTILDQGKDHELKVDSEGLLIVRTLHARHAGDYECEASNELGNLKASFKIDVQYAPFFTHHQSYFNGEEYNDIEIHCLYKAFPAPISVKWLKGNTKIHENNKYKIENDMREHHDRTKLLIKNVTSSDFMMYQCEVENALGTRRENVTLGLGPAPAKFEGYKYINNIVYTDWIIKSRQPLTEMEFTYRNKEDPWQRKSAQITNRNEVRPGEWKVQASFKMDEGEWDITPRARNTESWSDDIFAHVTSIKIPKDSIESQNQTSSASIISSTICGLLTMIFLQRLA